MKIHPVSLVILLGAFFLQAEAFRPPKCKGKEAKMSKAELKVLMDCVKEFGSDSAKLEDIPKDNMGVFKELKKIMVANTTTEIKNFVKGLANGTIGTLPSSPSLTDLAVNVQLLINDFVKKFQCVGKCILQKQGLIDEAGIPVKSNVFKMVEEFFEPDIAKIADERVGKCIDEKSDGIDVNEKACNTYWPFIECIATAFAEICMSDADADTATTTAPS